MIKKTVLAVLVVVTAFAISVQAEETEERNWKAGIALGINRKDGNTDKSVYKLELDGELTHGRSLWKFKANESYGKTDNEKDTDNGKAALSWDFNWTERFFMQLSGSAEYDKIADLDYRYILGAALGYYFIKTDSMSLKSEVGPSYVFEKINDEDEDYAGLRAAAEARYTFENGAAAWAKAEYLPRVDDFDQYLLNGETGVEAPLGYGLGVKVTLIDKYNSRPAPGKVYNDIEFNTALTFKF